MAVALERNVETTSESPTADRAGARGGLAVLLAGAAVALAAIGIVNATDAGAREIAHAALAIVWGIAGAVVIRNRPKEPLGFSIASFGVAAGLFAASSSAGNDLGRAVALGLMPAIGAHIVMGIADGRLGTTARRVAVGLFYAAGLGIAAWLRAEVKVWPLVIFGAVGFVAGAVGSTIRYRRSRGLERQRLQWFGWSVTVAATMAVLAGATRLLVEWPTSLGAAAFVATLPIPLALMLSSSQRLVARIDRLLAATVAIGGLTGVVVLTYLLIVLGLGRVPTQTERTMLLLSMIAAVVAALLYLPTRERLTTLANRIVYGERHAPDEVLRTFGSRMSRAIPLDELLLQMAESLRKTFALDMVEVWTGGGGALKRTISEPDRGAKAMQVGEKERAVVSRAGVSGNAWVKIWLPALLAGREGSLIRVAPIAHQGELLGLITLERRHADEPFTEENDRVLTELARQVGLALHNAELDSQLQATLDEVRRQADEIRASRQRIVATADAERRKLERNLHDGGQQHLVALKVKLGLIRQIQEIDPANAKMMLEQMQSDIDDAVQALRDLSHGIYPKVLSDRGLLAGLESAAAKAAIPTSVEPVGEISRQAENVEAAIYFVCLEALQNAGKHAGEGATATITVRETAEALEFSVTDTGAGFDLNAYGAGAGFVNMSDRLGAIGGTVTVRSEPGKGTSISGSVPLRA